MVSCNDETKYTGCAINSIMQMALSPASIAPSVNHDNYTNEVLNKTKKFAVSIHSEESAPLSIGAFVFRSCRNFDKFFVIPYDVIDELPIIKDEYTYLICNNIDKIETSTHTLFLAEVTNGDTLHGKKPMAYAYYHNAIKGKTPKTTPTYIEKKVLNFLNI